jgi:hypothetical protein
MKTFLTLLLATLCAATSYGQTLKALMYNTTNAQVVANTGTNLLTFVSTTNQPFSPVKFRNWDSGNEMQIVLTDEGLAAGYSAVRGSIGSGGGDFQIKYGNNSTEWGYPLIFASIGDGVWQTVSPASTTNDSYRFNRPISFDNTTNAAATRTNLGLGALDSVQFADVFADSFEAGSGSNYSRITGDGLEFGHAGLSAMSRTNLGLGATNTPAFRGLISDGNIVISNQSATNNGIVFIYRTNNEPFLGLANLIASNNTTISNETLFRVGTAEATNRSAQFGFRSTNTNGSGVAVFSVFGYNALMMIGADASTNAVVYSGGGTNNEVMTLIRDGATEFARPIRFSTNASTRPATNAPANTTNVAAWVEFRIGTNSYRAPLYQ